MSTKESNMVEINEKTDPKLRKKSIGNRNKIVSATDS